MLLLPSFNNHDTKSSSLAAGGCTGDQAGSSSRVRVEDGLCPALVAIVEMLVCLRCLFKRQFVRNDDGRIRLAGENEVTKPAVVHLHIALAGTHPLTLKPKLAKIKCNFPDFGEFVFRPGVLGNEHP